MCVYIYRHTQHNTTQTHTHTITTAPEKSHLKKHEVSDITFCLETSQRGPKAGCKKMRYGGPDLM